MLDDVEKTERRVIVDAHHHVWDPTLNYHPWLCDDPPIPFRYGDYGAIRRPYLPHHYRADTKPWRLAASVYVETEWDRSDETGEVDYVARLIAATSLPTVAVAHATMDAQSAPRVLESHASRDFVRGIRHKPRANPSPRDSSPGGTTDVLWRRNFATLSSLGLRYDVQTPWWHLDEVSRLAADFPDTMIIINHTGLPADRSPEAIAGWRAAMTTASRRPNISVKISGLGQPGTAWTAGANRGVVLTTIDLFGVDRCMFASNFPVDSLCGSFADIYGGFEEIVASLTAAEQHALFAANACRIYDIPASHLETAT